MSARRGDAEPGVLEAKDTKMKKLRSFLFVMMIVGYIGFWFVIGAKEELLEKADEVRHVLQTEVR